MDDDDAFEEEEEEPFVISSARDFTSLTNMLPGSTREKRGESTRASVRGRPLMAKKA